MLPTALERLERGTQTVPIQHPKSKIQNQVVPSLVWWLSLVWLEDGLWRFGALVIRLGTRMGLGLGRLEGRYYLPLALALTVIALLVVSR